jgi:hypothetical protein
MRKLLAIVILGSLLLGGCAVSQHGARHLTDVGRYTDLKKGVTTKKDIFISFGQPHDVQKTNENSTLWRYFQANTSSSAATFVPFVGMVAGGVDSQTVTATFTFDIQGKYLSVSTNTVNKTTNMWSLMGQAREAANADTKAERVRVELETLSLPFDANLAKRVSDIEVLARE